MYVMVVGNDESCIKEWYEKNLSGMMYVSITAKGGDSISNVPNGLNEERNKLEASFRTGNTVIHLVHGVDNKSIEQSMKAAKERGLTTALISFDDVKVDNNLVDIKYKV